MIEQSTQGSFVPTSCHRDILATALGKEDHPGRVIGVGKFVGIRAYHKPPSCDNRHFIREDVRWEVLPETCADVRREVLPGVRMLGRRFYQRLWRIYSGSY